jgi:formate dehydrogenase
MKVLAILYDGGKAAQEEPRLLGTVENKVGCPSYVLVVIISSSMFNFL